MSNILIGNPVRGSHGEARSEAKIILLSKRVYMIISKIRGLDMRMPVMHFSKCCENVIIVCMTLVHALPIAKLGTPELEAAI